MCTNDSGSVKPRQSHKTVWCIRSPTLYLVIINTVDGRQWRCLIITQHSLSSLEVSLSCYVTHWVCWWQQVIKLMFASKQKEKNAIAQSIYFLSSTIWFYEADYGDGEKVCQTGKRKFHYLYISYIFLLLMFSQDRLMILFNEISNCCVFDSLPIYFNLPVY